MARFIVFLMLWIAFKNYYLRDTTQPLRVSSAGLQRCELLSKIIIFVTRHNTSSWERNSNGVVNCFQKLLSSWHDTTSQNHLRKCVLLWIAFKNYYLRDTTQPSVVICSRWNRCELLSKIIIFVTRHNDDAQYYNPVPVVNCFQKLLSSWHDTTSQRQIQDLWMLWIAFKNYYLRDTTQPVVKTVL